jgi:hypothetical protein
LKPKIALFKELWHSLKSGNQISGMCDSDWYDCTFLWFIQTLMLIKI